MSNNPPKWLKIAIPIHRMAADTEASRRRIRRYATQGRIVAPGGSNGAWQAYPGAGWVCHPQATVNYPDLGRPYKDGKKSIKS